MISLRALKVAVWVMGVMLLVGTLTLGVLIVQRLGAGVAGTVPEAPPLALGQPPGSRIAALAGAGDRLAILVERPDGEARVVLVDPRRGRAVGEIRAGH